MKQLSLQILIPVKKEERRRKVDLCHGQSYVFVMISKLNKRLIDLTCSKQGSLNCKFLGK